MTSETKFWGKYRVTIVNNIDPESMGRILAVVPDESGMTPLGWAMQVRQVRASGSVPGGWT